MRAPFFSRTLRAGGWSEPVPGRELHPLKSSAFHGALFQQPRTVAAIHRQEFGMIRPACSAL